MSQGVSAATMMDLQAVCDGLFDQKGNISSTSDIDDNMPALKEALAKTLWETLRSKRPRCWFVGPDEAEAWTSGPTTSMEDITRREFKVDQVQTLPSKIWTSFRTYPTSKCRTIQEEREHRFHKLPIVDIPDCAHAVLSVVRQAMEHVVEAAKIMLVDDSGIGIKCLFEPAASTLKLAVSVVDRYTLYSDWESPCECPTVSERSDRERSREEHICGNTVLLLISEVLLEVFRQLRTPHLDRAEILCDAWNEYEHMPSDVLLTQTRRARQLQVTWQDALDLIPHLRPTEDADLYSVRLIDKDDDSAPFRTVETKHKEYTAHFDDLDPSKTYVARVERLSPVASMYVQSKPQVPRAEDGPDEQVLHTQSEIVPATQELFHNQRHQNEVSHVEFLKDLVGQEHSIAGWKYIKHFGSNGELLHYQLVPEAAAATDHAIPLANVQAPAEASARNAEPSSVAGIPPQSTRPTTSSTATSESSATAGRPDDDETTPGPSNSSRTPHTLARPNSRYYATVETASPTPQRAFQDGGSSKRVRLEDEEDEEIDRLRKSRTPRPYRNTHWKPNGYSDGREREHGRGGGRGRN